MLYAQVMNGYTGDILLVEPIDTWISCAPVVYQSR